MILRTCLTFFLFLSVGQIAVAAPNLPDEPIYHLVPIGDDGPGNSGGGASCSLCPPTIPDLNANGEEINCKLFRCQILKYLTYSIVKCIYNTRYYGTVEIHVIVNN
jgi:hypothetical protein